MLRRKIHIHFNSYKKHFFSQLINKEKHDKITGNVIMFDKRKGYGFIKPNDGGPDIFVHYTDICQSRTFEVTNEEKKKLAWNANMDITQKKEEYNFEYDNNNNKHNKKKKKKLKKNLNIWYQEKEGLKNKKDMSLNELLKKENIKANLKTNEKKDEFPHNG
ncbi:cold-shock protein [Plasmodium falciparum IGH-CR14]|uniref:Cold-shock protein n=2 Tax=Plasmodium (Laverania) TaxID=418107 RepID=A0A0L1I8E0_PLAFA|nr:cold-shock protein [Plasmodium falciparum IGH-CR14]